uniref:N-acetyl-D-glucosamine ABC transport system, sugar-binding protein n=1 Tax=uncultured bacterium contig00002 TaxID=1181494 RepID=A0A806KBE1_9BACT|nr:N-acetyl-D-glucosamine ABC transport system, sugar-binding protein [uncultured bacterium contig00002]
MTRNFFSVRKMVAAAAVIAVIALIFLVAGRREQDYSAKYAGFDLSGAGAGRTNIYSRYLERYAHIPAGQGDIPVDIFAWTSGEGLSILENFEGTNQVLRTEEASYAEYAVNIENEGLYFINMEYYPLPSRGIPIERSLMINGEIPFLGADRLVFQRVWGDNGASRFDNQGNEIRPQQIEIPRWESAWFRDSLGYITEPYAFYFHEGENIIRLTGINEPMAIRSLSLRAPAGTVSYGEYLAGVDLNRYRNRQTDFSLTIQGESAARRSDPSLYAIYDRSSGATDPASVAQIKLNMIGGEIWRVAGQWIEWEFSVPENGMYRISIKGRQNYNRGFVSNRTVMIDGRIPCLELASVPFTYSNKWNYVTLNDGRGDILFPLESGTHTLRLQATLGGMGEMLDVMEESVYRLNSIYRKILVLTGPEPDVYRDYRIDEVYPEIIEAMELESRILYKLVDDLTGYAGERGAEAAVALTLARQLEYFVSRPDKIPRTLINFKFNISSLGDSLLALSQSRLDIDYIIVSAEDAQLPRIRENFFVSASHEIRSFLSSFFVNYNNLGDVYKKGENAIEVWMLAGRDQSNILKAMIDDTFTPLTGIKVNVKLVAQDAVMPAVVAGTGPDMVLTVPQGDVINYALRKAVLDISKLSGYADVIKELDRSVIIPFEFQGGVYGLPETQYYHVMYYRKDILQELNIDLPDTWDDLINILPVIQKNNMNVGVPSVATSVQANIDFSNFLAHLFQRGGRLYNEDGSRTLLDTEIAIEAFDFYTKLYTHYKAPVVYDFINRFRTGEMPIAFADYSLFNTLEVFAPEIRGLWGFALMPGLKKENGVVDRSVSTGTLAAMIFSQSDYQDQAWEFLKWWVSSGTQLRFGRELESLMGAAARYPTANYYAFRQLSWGSEQMAVLDEQRSWTVGIPEVPGGYFVSRHITNAVRRVINEGEDTRETLLDYSITINDELVKKRKEFGLE